MLVKFRFSFNFNMVIYNNFDSEALNIKKKVLSAALDSMATFISALMA